MSKAALSSNFVPQIETRTAFEEAALAIPAGGVKAPPMTFRRPSDSAAAPSRDCRQSIPRAS
jgi:hypothetical protein